MAQIGERLPQNVPGEFFVDESCIDCDACRQIAPASFRDHGGKSSVYHQPENPGELHRAFMALVGSAPFPAAAPTPAWRPSRFMSSMTFIIAGSTRKQVLGRGLT
jgi:hypothetical protein